MSLKLAALVKELPQAQRKKLTRASCLELLPEKEWGESRTEQCHKDECDINKIMARYQVNGTISHVNKYQGVYADFSDFDFHAHTQKLTQGREIFDALPSEVRDEFRQSPQAFFDFVNDPANKDDLLEKLPALAAPGDQLPPENSPTADRAAREAAASEPVASETATETQESSGGPPATSEAE